MNRKPISYGRQWIDKSDIDAVINVLKSDYLTQGSEIPRFEEALSSYVGAKNAIALSSGTAALHIAYLALGIGVGDEVITTPITFAATSNAILYTGAKPIFVDIDPETGIIDVNKIEEAITPRTKAIAPVHYAGLSCDMVKIAEIAKKHNLFVIEDACHALGATIHGEKIGSCKYSDITVFSFHPVKHITTGEGGAITTNDDLLYKKTALLRSHGIEKHTFTGIPDSPCYQEMIDLGYNYRITEIQAALGLSQLRKINTFLDARRCIAKFYRTSFKDIENISIPAVPEGYEHAYHLFPLLFKTGEMRDEAFKILKSMGISCQIHYIPVNKHLYYQQNGYVDINMPMAYDFYRRELSIPIYPKMTKGDIKFTSAEVKKAAEAVK